MKQINAICARLFQYQEAGEVHGLEGVGVALWGCAVGARGDHRGSLRHRHHRLPSRHSQLYALGMFRLTICLVSGLYGHGSQLRHMKLKRFSSETIWGYVRATSVVYGLFFAPSYVQLTNVWI